MAFQLAFQLAMGHGKDIHKRSRKPASAREQASRQAMIDRKKSQHQAKQVEAARAGRARMQHNLFGIRQNAAADVSAQQPVVVGGQPATGSGAKPGAWRAIARPLPLPAHTAP